MRRHPKPNLNRKEAAEQLTHLEKLENHHKMRSFLRAVYSDVASAAKLLVADRTCIHYRSSIGETVFHYLVIENQIDLAGKLLDWGSNIDTQDNFGSTPVMHAVILHNLELVKWLTARGASLDFKTVNHDTALSYATSNKGAKIFDFLISLPRKNPIDFYYTDSDAQTVHTDTTLVMREQLITLGLTKRFDDLGI
jgi:ankyrin repeat protein